MRYSEGMRSLLLLQIVLLAAGLLFIVKKWPGGLHMTFSQHAASDRRSKAFYSLLFLVALPILLWFFTYWLVPQKHLPPVFLGFAWIAAIFQILCTFVPEDGGIKTVIHRIFAGISGIALLPLVTIIALSPSTSWIIQSIASTGLIVMLILLGIALAKQKGFRWALLLQIGYYTVFFVVLLATTYL